jgi:predicted YcjX-like family ATPase
MSQSQGFGGWLWSGVRSTVSGLTDTVDSSMNEKRIRLAVTGLSRSGKTVFITSLIQNLIALGEGRDTLPLITSRLDSNGRSRLRKVTVEPASVQTIPYFDFQAKLQALSRPDAAWPPRTEDLSEISISLEIEREGLWQKFGTRRVRMDILDYPGEWLLDLPLLDQSYAAWSEDTIERLSTPAMLPKTAPFLDYLRGLSPSGPAEEATTRRGHALYKALLFDLRNDMGLRYLQPGRFLCPGPFGDAPFLWFFPMAGTDASLPAGSLGRLLQARFETYKREIRSSFFDTYFKAFDRQIMLVDVLGCLYAGKAAFEDTAAAIHDLAVALRDGWGTWSRGGPRRGESTRDSDLPWPLSLPVTAAMSVVSALFGTRPVDRVAIAATKADHVPELDRQALKLLLAHLAKSAAGAIESDRATVSYHVVSSIRSTEDVTLQLDGRAVRAVQGVLVSGGRARPFSPGQIPAAEIPDYFWDAAYFELPDFRPPRIDPSGNEGIRHLGLDEVLDAVIGDRL